MKNTDHTPGPIGVFDSGYGGLTILRCIRRRLPEYSYLYLGDNARAPYGPRSFEVVRECTLQAVRHLFAAGCQLVILACNTASAKALRSIQQEYLPGNAPDRRVLGVIRPTVEALPAVTRNGHVGLMATAGTVASHSYRMETAKTDVRIRLTELACPLLVPLIENGEADSQGADWFVRKYTARLLQTDPLSTASVATFPPTSACSSRVPSWPRAWPTISVVTPRWRDVVCAGPTAGTSPPRNPASSTPWPLSSPAPRSAPSESPSDPLK